MTCSISVCTRRQAAGNLRLGEALASRCERIQKVTVNAERGQGKRGLSGTGRKRTKEDSWMVSVLKSILHVVLD
jgi:hypothetical protein